MLLHDVFLILGIYPCHVALATSFHLLFFRQCLIKDVMWYVELMHQQVVLIHSMTDILTTPTPNPHNPNMSDVDENMKMSSSSNSTPTAIHDPATPLTPRVNTFDSPTLPSFPAGLAATSASSSHTPHLATGTTVTICIIDHRHRIVTLAHIGDSKRNGVEQGSTYVRIK